MRDKPCEQMGPSKILEGTQQLGLLLCYAKPKTWNPLTPLNPLTP